MQRELVTEMYEIAGLGEEDIDADLDQINNMPVIEATSEGVEYFRTRTHTGDIGIPVIHGSNIADGGTPAAVMAGYVSKIQAQSRDGLYRQAFMENAGHCTYNTAEQASLVDAMVERIRTGEWGDISAQALNALGSGVNGEEPRFIDIDHYDGFALPSPFNREFSRDTEVPGLL